MSVSEDHAEASEPAAPTTPAGEAGVAESGAPASEARGGAGGGGVPESDAHADADDDGLLNRIDVIESQPLAQRAAFFEQVHDELLAELQRGDRGGA